MKKNLLGLILWICMVYSLYANETIVIGNVMYQNQPFTTKDKHIFDTDWEGLRVWRWTKAQNYCGKLKLDGYDGWRAASQKELQALMTKKSSKQGLFVKSAFASAMPMTGGKYDDVWMWTRDSKSSKVGAFVNFKKAKIGWADKSYKGYVICSRSIGKRANTLIMKLKRPILFEYEGKVWRSDMTQKGTKPLGRHTLLTFYCQNGIDAPIPRVSRLIKHKKSTYFFAYKGKNNKRLNLYRTNGSVKGTKKIGSIGNEVAYSPVWVGDKLYFLSSDYFHQQSDPLKEKLWVVDTRTNSMKYVGKTASEKKGNMYSFAKSNTKLFFKYISYDEKRKQEYQEIWAGDPKKGLKKVKRFRKIPDNLKNIKITGKNHKLKPLNTLKWGCDDVMTDDKQDGFKISQKSCYYQNKKILNLSSVKDLKVYDVKIVFSSEKYALIASNGNLWGVDSRGNIQILRDKK